MPAKDRPRADVVVVTGSSGLIGRAVVKRLAPAFRIVGFDREGWRVTDRWRLKLDVFNLLDAKVSDIDYFYTSRLRGEPAAGVDDIHTHPIEPRSVRLGVTASF